MLTYRITGAALAAIAFLAVDARAGQDTTTMNFAVLRDGTQIGTNFIKFGRKGADTTVQTVTHVEVGFGFLTLYKFDQTETEQWDGGHLVAMNATTDDNGSVHRASAAAHDGKIVVRADDRMTEAAPGTVPLNFWNVALVEQNVALDPKDGSIKPIKVVDRGEDTLPVQGHNRRTHHYEIVTTFPQDVWYDDKDQLVQVELKGSDGSLIRYQLM